MLPLSWSNSAECFCRRILQVLVEETPDRRLTDCMTRTDNFIFHRDQSYNLCVHDIHANQLPQSCVEFSYCSDVFRVTKTFLRQPVIKLPWGVGAGVWQGDKRAFIHPPRGLARRYISWPVWRPVPCWCRRDPKDSTLKCKFSFQVCFPCGGWHPSH